MPGDIHDFADALADRAVSELGRLDVWVNNVGGSEDKRIQPLVETPDDTFRKQLELNLTSVFQGCVAAARRMAEGGAIVNISSGAGMRGAPNTGPYGAAKAGVINLTMTLAEELAPRGIRVNAIAPGMVPTEAFFQVLQIGEDELDEYAAKVPLGRLGTPDDIAAAVVFFASPAGAWITGQNLLVSGGREGGRSGIGRYSEDKEQR
jgi:3-oxoacyl-[acyl-carrier protein] reductase